MGTLPRRVVFLKITTRVPEQADSFAKFISNLYYEYLYQAMSTYRIILIYCGPLIC